MHSAVIQNIVFDEASSQTSKQWRPHCSQTAITTTHWKKIKGVVLTGEASPPWSRGNKYPKSWIFVALQLKRFPGKIIRNPNIKCSLPAAKKKSDNCCEFYNACFTRCAKSVMAKTIGGYDRDGHSDHTRHCIEVRSATAAVRIV